MSATAVLEVSNTKTTSMMTLVRLQGTVTVGAPEVEVPVVGEVEGPVVVGDVDCAGVEAGVVAAKTMCTFSDKK